MSFNNLIRISIFCYIFIQTRAAVHDDLPQCGLSGIYRMRQSVLESPNYPDNYPVNTCWDYIIRSPYRCPTKFHIQFLDFYLESTPNCTNDYLAIGLENDGDDMDVLCGQVIGIRKYHTPDGILRLRFFTDNSPWTTGKGFKLLITRLACERVDYSRDLSEDEDDYEDDSVHVHAAVKPLKPPRGKNFTVTQEVRKPFGLPPAIGGVGGYPGQYINQLANQLANSYPAAAGQQYPGLQLPQPPVPSSGLGGYYLPAAFNNRQLPGASYIGVQPQVPCTQQQQQQQVGTLTQQQPLGALSQQQPLGALSQQNIQQSIQPQAQVQQQQLPTIADQYLSTAFQPQQPTFKDYDPQNLQQFGPETELCCASSFSQQHFYLSSPGFPRVFTALLPQQQRDCVFYLEKNTPSVCRLRIQFKFFDFGRNSQINEQFGQANYPQLNQPRSCADDFIELDGQRFCGCRSGYVYKSFWPGQLKKGIRMRMGYNGGTPSNGFLLEIFQEHDQDGCRQDLALGLNPAQAGILGAVGGGAANVQQDPIGGFGLQQSQGLYGINFAQPGLQQIPNLLQQQGLLPQQQPQQPLLPHAAGYQHAAQLPTHPWQLPGYGYGQLPQYRSARRVEYARGINTHQPLTVVETNSTRKEFYYYDGDEAFARAAANRADDTGALDDTEDNSNDVGVSNGHVNTKAFEQSSCTFDYMEVLKLSVDTLWLTKPICFAPLRNWFGNIFG